MYGQLTTGKPVQITSRTGARAPAHYFEMQIDTKKNEPRIFENKKIDWESPRGTQVTLEIEGRYQKGRASVDEYLEQTAIANPHVQLVYHTPEGETREYPRTIHELPPPAAARSSRIPTASSSASSCGCSRTRRATRSPASSPSDFSRVSPAVAQEICRTAKLSPNARPRNVHGEDAEALYKAIQTTKIMAPPSNCHLAHRREGDPPRPLQADQGRVLHRGHPPARRVPRQSVRDRGGARLRARGRSRRRRPPRRARCRSPRARSGRTTASSRASSATRTASRSSTSSRPARPSRRCWRPPGATTASPSPGAPSRPGPMVIFVHMASVWVPFTSESKEAIADYDEIRKEIKLALQECGRRLGVFLRRRERAKSEFRRRNIFELYIEEVVEACARLKGGAPPQAAAQGPAPEDRREADGRDADRRDPGPRQRPGGPPHSIIVTAEGPEGEAPELPARRRSVRRRRAPARAAQVRHVRRDRTARPTAGRRAGGARPGATPRRPRPRQPAPRRRAEDEAEDRHGGEGEALGRRSRRSSSAWPTS